MNQGMEWPYVHMLGDVSVGVGGFVLGPRTIEDYELVYFPEGTDTIYLVEGMPEVRLDEPCFLLTPPGVSHQYRFDPARKVRHLFAHFDHGPLRRGEPRFQGLLRSGGRHRVPDGGLAADLMGQMLRRAGGPSPTWKEHVSVLLAAALEELIAQENRPVSEEASPLPAPVVQALAYMDRHLNEQVTVEELARLSGWSHEHFTRMFVSSIGMPPKRALLERRLRRAEELMLQGAGTVKQIAFAVGFRDEHHFSKTYKRMRGITATAYMERCRDPLLRHAAAGSDAAPSSNRIVVVNDRIN